MKRTIAVSLEPHLTRVLSQEKVRLRREYGLTLSSKDIIAALIEQHRLRMLDVADDENAELWYYQHLRNQLDDIATETSITAKLQRDADLKAREDVRRKRVRELRNDESSVRGTSTRRER